MMKDVSCSQARNRNVTMKMLFLEDPMDKEDEQSVQDMARKDQ